MVKSFKELTRRERLFRIRKIARDALMAYGMNDATLKFIQYNENFIYRVDLPDRSKKYPKGNPYHPNRYVLRLHAWDEREKINSEMIWLEALTGEEGLPVPKPVSALDGKKVVYVDSSELSKGKCVTLLRWMNGRKLDKGTRPIHLKALGRVMAKLHNFSARWRPPEGFIRPHWNWEAQLGESVFKISRETLIDSMPIKYQEPFRIVSQRAKDSLIELGEGIDAFGLIHADLYPENVLYNGGQAYPIDFEDGGYGYWIWDIAVALCTWAWKAGWEQMRDAFFKGYSEIRPLPDMHWADLDLFIAAQYATMAYWASAFLKKDPMRQSEYQPWREESCQRLLDYFNRV